MTPLLLLLVDGPPPGAWRVDRFDALRCRLVESFGYRVVVIDIDPSGDKMSLLDQVAEALGFPDWFGRNWDALSDALSDRGLWDNSPTSTGVVPDLIVLRAVPGPREAPHPEVEPGDDAATMIEIFDQVASDTGFCVLIAGLAAGRRPTAE